MCACRKIRSLLVESIRIIDEETGRVDDGSVIENSDAFESIASRPLPNVTIRADWGWVWPRFLEYRRSRKRTSARNCILRYYHLYPSDMPDGATFEGFQNAMKRRLARARREGVV